LNRVADSLEAAR